MKIVLGSANFGNNYGLNFKNNINKRKDLNILFFEAKKLKINFLDTSPNYKIKKNILVKKKFKEFNIISKLRFTEKEKKNKKLNKIFLKKILKIKKNYKIKNFYGILFHRSDDLLSFKKDLLKDTIRLLKKKKICKKFGVSIYDPAELKKVFKIFKPDIIQLPINILDNRFVKSGWINKLYGMNIEIHARSIFLQSLLLNSYKKSPKNIVKNSEILKKFENYCKLKKVTKLDMCLNYIKKFPQISHIIVGVQDANQLKKISISLNRKKFKSNFNVKKIDKKIIDPRLW